MRSEEDVNMRKAALRTLLDYSSPRSPYDPNRSTRTNEGKSLIFGDNSFVSFTRGMESCNQSTPVTFRNGKGVQSFENQISEADFFDAETGKQLILNDQVSSERLIVQRTDCTECSSWTFCSRKNLSSIASDFSKFKQKTVSVGEFIGMFSETLTFSENEEKEKPFLNCLTSTPKEKRKSKSTSSLLEMKSKESSYTSCMSCDLKKDISCMATPKSSKPLKFSTPKWNAHNSHSDDFHYFIGSALRKNIMRLQKEEQLQGADGSYSINSLDSDKTIKQSNSGATGSDTITRVLKSDLSVLTNDTMDRRSCYAQWFVEPQLVMLNPNKGNRVRLVNNSNRSLKFKTTFDSRKVNVCPLSGAVLAMDKIGLRLCISKSAKKQNESFEDDVKVIIGKNEKSIQVRFIKEEKSKSLKERSYILF